MDATAVMLLLLLQAVILRWWSRGNRARDRLTDLPTREGLTEMIAECATRAVWRADYRYALVVLEFDRQKLIRRTVGRFGAEDAMADTAERLTLCTRDTDVVARIGDRRFGVLLDEVIDSEAALYAARRLVAALDEASTLSGRRVRTTPEAGVAFSGARNLSPEEMLARAEESLDHQRSPAGHESAEHGLLRGRPTAPRQLEA